MALVLANVAATSEKKPLKSSKMAKKSVNKSIQKASLHEPSCSAFDGSLASLEKCQDKLVTLTVTMARFAEQHPVGLHNQFDPTTGKSIMKVETYVELAKDGAQIVLTSDKQIKCDGKIVVEGIVDIVEQGGAAGTKFSYRRPWIKVQKYHCE